MSRVTKKPTDRREEIIKAARKLFLTKDYDKTTMQDVMSALGIAKGTIYHYFDSKEKLLEAVVLDIVNSRVADIEKKMQQAKGSVLENLRKLVELSQVAKEYPQLVDHLHRPANAGMHTRLLAETLLKFTPIYEKLIRQGCDENIFHTEHPLECAEFILAAVQFLTDTGIYPWTKEDMIRRAKALPHLIEQQLKAPQGTFKFLCTSW